MGTTKTIEVLVEGRRRAATLAAHLLVAGYRDGLSALGRDRFAVVTDCPASELHSVAPAWCLRGRIVRHEVLPAPTPAALEACVPAPSPVPDAEAEETIARDWCARMERTELATVTPAAWFAGQSFAGRVAEAAPSQAATPTPACSSCRDRGHHVERFVDGRWTTVVGCSACGFGGAA